MFLYNNSEQESPLESLLLKKSSFFHHHRSYHHQDSKQYDDHHQPPFFSDFPNPFFDEHELIMPLNHILPHPMPPAKPESNLIENIHSETPTKPETPVNSASTKLKRKAADDDNPPLKRRNLGKKDRHSKIRTAQGVRDRRMRLSLQIARKFFDLQDMLGYDKASNTIEWLFGKSKKSIKELMTATKGGTNNSNFSVTESFLSECEAVSGVEVSSGNRRLGRKKPRKPNNNVRESREKARARARWRTREKMRVRLGFQSNYCEDDQRLGFCNDQLGVVDQGLSWNFTSFLSKDVGNSSASNNFFPVSGDYQSCIDPSSNLMEFLGDWDLLSNVTNQVSSMAEKVNPNNYLDYSAPNFALFHQ